MFQSIVKFDFVSILGTRLLCMKVQNWSYADMYTLLRSVLHVYQYGILS